MQDRVKPTMRGRPIPTIPTDHHKIRVMLIDDHTIFLRRLSTFLMQVPEVDLVGVLSGCEGAVAQAQSLGAQVVILGLTTSGLPELQVIARLKKASPDIGVIVLTLRDLAPYREAALGAGATEFVSRLTAGIDLLPAIRRVAAAMNDSKHCQAPGPISAGKKAAGNVVKYNDTLFDPTRHMERS